MFQPFSKLPRNLTMALPADSSLLVSLGHAKHLPRESPPVYPHNAFLAD
jgi:hypothetical protein